MPAPAPHADPGEFQVFPWLRQPGYGWRFVNPSGGVTLTSGGVFHTAADAEHDATQTRDAATGAAVRVLTSPHKAEAGA